MIDLNDTTGLDAAGLMLDIVSGPDDCHAPQPDTLVLAD